MAVNQFAGGYNISETPEQEKEGTYVPTEAGNAVTEDIFGPKFDETKQLELKKAQEEVVIAEKKENKQENPDDLLVSLDDKTEKQETNISQGGQILDAQDFQENSNNLSQEELLEQTQANERVKGSKYYNALRNLKEAGYIDDEQFTEITKELQNATKDEEKQAVKDFIERNATEGEAKINALRQFEGKDNYNADNFAESDFFKDSTELKLDIKEDGASDLDVMLANSYTSMPNKNGTENKERDLVSAMDTVKNDIILAKDETFKKQNADVIQKVADAKNLTDKYKALTELHELSLIKNAELASKGKESARMKALKEDFQRKDDDLRKKYEDLMASNVSQEEKAKQKELIVADAKKLKEETLAQVKSLGGGEKDIINSDKEQNKYEDPLAA